MKKYIKKSQRHSFHLVDPSPWPIFSAFSALFLTFGCVLWMHGYRNGFAIAYLGYALILLNMLCWWEDVIREATLEGQHTNSVASGLRLGMILFIISEIMFFFGFFWAFFYLSFNPNPNMGCIWPSNFITSVSPWTVPLLNTLILLTSGGTITAAHAFINQGLKNEAIVGTNITVWLAIFFLYIQRFEYTSAPFGISDSAYGSCFFLLTGFHGFHVFVGALFLYVCMLRLLDDHFTIERHLGFEFAAWYWHFVDVVWLFLFIALYWWGF